MKVSIICVNYNSYEQLERYIESINEAYKNHVDSSINIFVADNSKEVRNVTFKTNMNISITHYNNLGYFGGALSIIKENPDITESDYVIISNVDLEVDKSFFSQLSLIECNETIGWIAPQIYSTYENRDKNPQRLCRCSKSKLRMLIFMFSHPFVQRIYKNTLYKRKKNQIKHNDGEKIYCGHGSFIILTKFFFTVYQNLQYPCFLYGEELFLGELIRKAGLDVVYNSKLKIIDAEHVSTGQLPSKSYYKYNKDALMYIFNTFYRG